MTWHVHVLDACAPRPLARYLKALGILRVVGEQFDSGARGFWKRDVFHLVTTKSIDELVEFFAETWQPTPIVTPWNADGGFLGENPNATAAMACVRELAGRGERFVRYVEGAIAASELVAGMETSPKDEAKRELFEKARREWSDHALAWLDSVVAILPDRDNPGYPPLLGSGGCDGRFDFATGYRRRLELLFGADKKRPSPEQVRRWLRAALQQQPLPRIPRDSGGQLDPANTGPVNGGTGFRGESLVNPWDYLLAYEGVPVLRVTASRRLRSQTVLASAPFQVRGSAAGYASSSTADERGRGEQWMPLWSRPVTLDEVRQLFAEGRMMTSGRSAASALDAAKAIARLGVARGIEAFERFAYAPRNGQSTLAIPLGRWPVVRNPKVRLLDELDEWLDRLRQQARGATAPASLLRDVRRIESAMLEVARSGALPSRWQDLIILLGEAESNLAARSRFTAEARLQPLPPLRADWLEAAADGSAELRLAAAIALQGLPESARDKNKHVLGPIRIHALPLDPERGWQRFATGEGSLKKDPRVVWQGHDLISDLAAVAARRILEGGRNGLKGFPLTGPPFAGLDDITAFLVGAVDEQRISSLARGLMALRPVGREVVDSLAKALGRTRGAPVALHALVRMTHLSEPLGDVPAHADGAIVRLLLAGRLDEAVRMAVTRLRAAGLNPRLRGGVGTPELARRLAATIAIPVSHSDLERLLASITKPASDEAIADAMT